MGAPFYRHGRSKHDGVGFCYGGGSVFGCSDEDARCALDLEGENAPRLLTIYS